MAPTLYQPLQDWQTRILRLQPGEFGEPLEGDLDIVDLEGEVGVLIYGTQQRTQYDAVSYCWGGSRHKRSIQCNGNDLPITWNLYDGLQRIRSRSRVLCLWIDSICICQADLEERSKQVPMMLDIYSRARLVIAWLGEQHLYAPLSQSEYDRLPRDIARGIRPGDPLLLAARPWASRIWVRQEIWAAKEILLRWHDTSMYWNEAFGGHEMKLGFHRSTETERLRMTFGDPPRNILSSELSSTDILRILNRCAGCQCSDLRDHVYGVLGMSTVSSYMEDPVSSNSRALQVDYRRSVSRVFQDMAEYIIKRDGDLVILSLDAKFGGVIRSSNSVIPSWVPDWRSPTHRPAAIIANEKGRPFFHFDVRNPASRMDWLDSDVSGGLRVRAWNLGTVTSVSASNIMVMKVRRIGLFAWRSFRNWSRKIRGCVWVEVGARTVLWQHRDAGRQDLRRLINGLLSVTTFEEYGLALRRGRSRGDSARHYLPVVFSHDNTSFDHELWIPHTRVDKEPLRIQGYWSHPNYKMEFRKDMAQATTDKCLGPAQLRETSRLSRGGTGWRKIISNLVSGDAYLNDFFNHPVNLWFIKRWIVPFEAMPGDMIVAIRGALQPIVVRPQGNPGRVEFIGRADFGVGREHGTLGAELQRCDQQMVRYRHGRRDGLRYAAPERPRSRSRELFVERVIPTKERERLADYTHNATKEYRMLGFYYDLITAAMRKDVETGNVFEDLTIV